MKKIIRATMPRQCSLPHTIHVSIHVDAPY